MGCTSSNDANYDFDESYRVKYTKLSEEHKTLVKYFEDKIDGEGEDKEQINLLRYKVELLLTMLAMEEKSKEVVSNRIETMKLMLVSQGTSEQQLDELMVEMKGKSTTSATINIESDYDMASAIEKMNKIFQESKNDIISILADEDGNIDLKLTREEFIDKLISVIQLPKKDLMIISMRFFDGNYVSTTEFISFFTTPITIRHAQTASTAVNMNEDILDIQQSIQYPGINDDDGGGGGGRTNTSIEFNTSQFLSPQKDGRLSLTNYRTSTLSSHLGNDFDYETATIYKHTQQVDIGIIKLCMLWKYVKEFLIESFMQLRENNSRSLTTPKFQEILQSVCGTQSPVIPQLDEEKLTVNETTLIKMSFLSSADINILTEYFELGGRIPFYQFIKFIERKIKIVDPDTLISSGNYQELIERMNATNTTLVPPASLSPRESALAKTMTSPKTPTNTVVLIGEDNDGLMSPTTRISAPQRGVSSSLPKAEEKMTSPPIKKNLPPIQIPMSPTPVNTRLNESKVVSPSKPPKRVTSNNIFPSSPKHPSNIGATNSSSSSSSSSGNNITGRVMRVNSNTMSSSIASPYTNTGGRESKLSSSSTTSVSFQDAKTTPLSPHNMNNNTMTNKDRLKRRVSSNYQPRSPSADDYDYHSDAKSPYQ